MADKFDDTSNDAVLNYLFSVRRQRELPSGYMPPDSEWREGEPELPIDGKLIPCPSCQGDGIETCHNPDHGFIAFAGGETGRLGCPCCGHDENFKLPGKPVCPYCDGAGEVTIPDARKICDECYLDFAIMVDYLCEPDEITGILEVRHG